MASKSNKKYAPAILSSFDLSFTIHSSQSQSRDTIPLMLGCSLLGNTPRGRFYEFTKDNSNSVCKGTCSIFLQVDTSDNNFPVRCDER